MTDNSIGFHANARARLILIHGFARSSEDQAAQIDVLRKEFEVVTVDLSSPPDAPLLERSLIVDMAEAVNRVRGGTSNGTVLIGHSLGCRVALEAARLRPTGVEGMVLIERSLRAAGDADTAVCAYLSHSLHENMRRLHEDFIRMFTEATAPSFRETTLHRLKELDTEYAVRLMADMTRWDAADAPKALRAVQAPMLILQSSYKAPGEQRRAICPNEISPWLRLVEEQARDRAEVVRIDGGGHFPQIEHAAAVNDLIRSFLHRIESRAGSR